MKSAYSNIDADHDAHLFLKDLDRINRQMPIQEYKRHALELLEVSTGQSVIDLGCGVGEDTMRLAEAVGASGRAVGIDKSSAMIAEAKRRFLGSHQSMSFEVCSAEQLPFSVAAFDRALIDRTLQHVDDPLVVLRETHRILTPSGRVVAIEPDWQTLIFDTSELDIAALFSRYMADTFVNTGRVGRTLLRLAREAGFKEVSWTPVTTILRSYSEAQATFGIAAGLDAMTKDGVASEADVARFRDSMQNDDNAGIFMAALTGFIYAGTKR